MYLIFKTNHTLFVGRCTPHHWCQLKTEIHDECRLSSSLDPPKSPLRRGVGVDFENALVPPFLRGVRGDLRVKKTRPIPSF